MTVPKSFRMTHMSGSKQFGFTWDGAQEWCLDDDFKEAAEKFIAQYAPHRIEFTQEGKKYFTNAGKIRRWLQRNASGWWYHVTDRYDCENNTYTTVLDMQYPSDMVKLKLLTNFEDFSEEDI